MTPSSSIGPYRVTGKLGEGGMGTVYRATDPRLHRDVAIKVLPDRFAHDSDRVARFEREAQVLASLNHPHIAQIYGLEAQALVMELVEGETLSGPLPLDTALEYARQIADALDAAHQKGIVHRDLKPSNIKVTADGNIKVLDFGLAAIAQSSRTTSGDPAQSPTLTLSATQAGMILGTAGYMAPEQARGKVVDKRADIWAFGVVLYEMLTGSRLFEGEDISTTLAAVLTKEPDWQRVPEKTRRLLKSCLERDPNRRLRDIADAPLLLEQATPVAPEPKRGFPWAITAAGVFALVAAAFADLWLRTPAPEVRPVHFQLAAPAATTFANVYAGTALSPNGRYLVFSATSDGQNALWLRPMDSSQANRLPGTETGTLPFWSPDSQSIGYFSDGKLKRMALGSGTTATICEAEAYPAFWTTDGSILFGSRLGILRVPSSGGTPVAVTEADPAKRETRHSFPQLLPDGKRLLFQISTADEKLRGLYAAPLANPRARTLILPTRQRLSTLRHSGTGPRTSFGSRIKR